VLLMEIFLGSHLRRAHRTHTYSLGRPQFVFAHGKRSLFNQKKRTKLGFLFRRARVYQKGRLAGGSPSKRKTAQALNEKHYSSVDTFYLLNNVQGN
jgi:hypothetical protein